MSHKRLKQYSVIAGGKLSKVIEFSKGEAEVYVRNFIETHLSHAVLKAAGGLKDIIAYFTDVPTMKDKLEKEAKSIIATVDKELEKLKGTGIVGDGDNNPLSGLDDTLKDALVTKLEEAKGKASLAIENILSVSDDSDFNKENIDQAKDYLEDSLANIQSYSDNLSTNTTDDNGNNTNSNEIKFEINDKDNPSEEGKQISISDMQSLVNNDLNKLRKWQLDKFEEEFAAEIYVNTYHEYKYAKTLEDFCDQLNTAIRALGADINLNYEEYWVNGINVMRSSDNSINSYASVDDFPETGEVEKYYHAANEDKWYAWTPIENSEPAINTESDEEHKTGEYTETTAPTTGLVNMEEDVTNALNDAHITIKRIDIDWHDKNWDPNEGENTFGYSY